MAWACHACTLINENVHGLACELCQTQRQSTAFAATGSVRRSIADDGIRRRPVKQARLCSGVDGAIHLDKGRLGKITASSAAECSNEKRPDSAADEVILEGPGDVGALVRDVATHPLDADRVSIAAHGTDTCASPHLDDKPPGIYDENRVAVVLKQVWGSTYSIKPFQSKVVKALLEGCDALVVSGTGSGKSLCFQLPPLLMSSRNRAHSGVALVVSPLIALMQDLSLIHI